MVIECPACARLTEAAPERFRPAPDGQTIAKYTCLICGHSFSRVVEPAEVPTISQLLKPPTSVAPVLRATFPKKQLSRVCIESPFAADSVELVRRNVAYAYAAMKDSLLRGEAPFAGHIFYTSVLDDNVPAQREIGLNAHLEYVKFSDLVVVYKDFGISPGMERALDLAKLYHIKVAERELGEHWANLLG